MHRRQLPIVALCDQDWEAMRADGQLARRCDVCATSVLDLSRMTEREARRVLALPGEQCIRYRTDGAGKVQFRQRSWPGADLAALISVLAVGSVGGLVHADSSVPAGSSKPENAVVGQAPVPQKKPPKPVPPPPPPPETEEKMGKRAR